MQVVLIILILVLILAGVGFGVVLVWRARTVLAPPPTPAESAPEAIQRRRAAEELGDELLSRRIELDGRRGTLQGNTDIDEAFDRLEAQRRSGQISEEEFEAEKIRLLGG